MTKQASLELIKSAVRSNFAIADSGGMGLFPVVSYKDDEGRSYEDSPQSANIAFMLLMMEYGRSSAEIEQELGLSTEEMRELKSKTTEIDPSRLMTKMKLCKNYIRLHRG